MSETEPIRPSAGLLDGPTLRDALPSIGLVVASGAGEIVVLAAVGSGLPWPAAIATHVLVIAGLAAWSHIRARAGQDIRLSVLGLWGVAGCGPIGAAGACLAFVVHAARRSAAHGAASAGPTPALAAARPDADALVRRILSTPHEAPRGSVASFNDVMALGTVEQKRAAISLIMARYRPEFTRALKRGLHDPEAAVRVQAASAVSRLESLFQRRVRELESALKAGGAEAIMRLANCLDEVAQTGLLDESRTASWRERALGLYRSIARERLADVALPIARALVRLGREREACEWCAQLPASIPMTSQLLLWRLDAEYRAGRYGELRSLCERYRALLGDPAPAPAAVLKAATLWGQGT